MSDDPAPADASVGRGAPATDFHRPVYAILGLPFDALGLDACAAKVRAAMDARQRCLVSTPNLNFVVACLSDDSFRASVLQSDLSLVDGMPLVWVARALGLPFRERVAGSSLFEALRAPGRAPVKVFFFGGPEGVAEQACARLDAVGSMTCAGWHSPGFGSIADMSAPAVIDAINASNADFLIVALGARKGQAWILANLDRLRIPLISHLGAVINFVAGTVTRAPERWQRLGLEWLWRIREEPQLWRRYASDGFVFVRLLATRVLPTMIDLRLRRPSAAALRNARIDVTSHPEETVVTVNGAWTAANLEAMRDAFERVSASPTGIVIDVAALAFFDSAFVGTLLLLQGHQINAGRAFRVRAAGARTRARFRRYGVRLA